MRRILQHIVILWLRTRDDLVDLFADGDESVDKPITHQLVFAVMTCDTYLSSSCFGSDSVGSISQHLIDHQLTIGRRLRRPDVEIGHCAVGGWKE